MILNWGPAPFRFTNKLNDVDSSRRIALKTDLSNKIHKETQLWTQRCKRLWLSDGNENTVLSHKSTTAKVIKGIEIITCS